VEDEDRYARIQAKEKGPAVGLDLFILPMLLSAVLKLREKEGRNVDVITALRLYGARTCRAAGSLFCGRDRLHRRTCRHRGLGVTVV